MFVLLSPAKKLQLDLATKGLTPTEPHFSQDAGALAARAKELDVGDLKALMKLSDNLATLNFERFASWSPDHSTGTPAALTFAGDVYQGLQAETLSADDLCWAQDHVGILSGLYGLLRPLDRIHPYRLEMGTSLSTDRGKNLYAFWGDKIAHRIYEIARSHTDSTVINLASQEYYGAVQEQALDLPVITPVFQDVSEGKARTISYYAKQARGAMARWIIENRVETPDQLKTAVIMDYRHDPQASKGPRWVFRRPKPPPKG